MVEDNGAFKHGRCDKIWLKSLHVTSNIRVFATEDSQPARQTDTTLYIGPYVKHIDQKSILLLPLCQVPGVTGSVLRLTGLVSLYPD